MRMLGPSCMRTQALSLALSPGGRGNCPCHIGYTEAAANTFISEEHLLVLSALRSPLPTGERGRGRGPEPSAYVKSLSQGRNIPPFEKGGGRGGISAEYPDRSCTSCAACCRMLAAQESALARGHPKSQSAFKRKATISTPSNKKGSRSSLFYRSTLDA